MSGPAGSSLRSASGPGCWAQGWGWCSPGRDTHAAFDFDPRRSTAYVVGIETKPPLKERLQTLLAEYGTVAIVIYFGIFALVFAGFAISIRFGVQVDSAAGTAGTLGAAYLATKLTQPLRILATLVLTPIVGKLVKRFWPAPKPPPSVG